MMRNITLKLSLSVSLWIGLLINLLSSIPVSHAGGLDVVASASTIGSFGLRVTAGPQCVIDDINETGPTVSTDRTACDTITTRGSVQITANATFAAGNQIAFAPGFSVAGGVMFVAQVNDIIDSDFAGLRDTSPHTETSLFARFDLDVENLAVSAGEDIGIFSGFSADNTLQLQIRLRDSGGKQIFLLVRQDNGGFLTSSGLNLISGFNDIEIEWQASSGPGVNDGLFSASLNSGTVAVLNAIDNDMARIDMVDMGLLDANVASPISTTGSADFDDFLSFR